LGVRKYRGSPIKGSPATAVALGGGKPVMLVGPNGGRGRWLVGRRGARCRCGAHGGGGRTGPWPNAVGDDEALGGGGSRWHEVASVPLCYGRWLEA
jgi:hypothetical protein